MVLSDIAIRRPVVAIVMSLLLVVFGIYAIMQMPIRETPNVDRPAASVNVNYPGASAEVIETRIVKLIEDQISGINGIKAINSFSRDGNASVNIEFDQGRNIDDATNDLREQVSRIVSRLPRDADAPVISKSDPDSSPMLYLSLFSKALSRLELSDYASLVLGPRLSTVDGVAQVQFLGLRKKSMRVWLDRHAMAARGLTVADVEAAIQRENVELGAGMLESKDRFITMKTVRPFQTPDQFKQLVVARGPNNYLIRLGEIAEVELGPVEAYSINRTNGQELLGMGIIKQPGASTLDVADAVRADIEKLRPSLPGDIELLVNVDNSSFIAQALKEVSIAGAVAGALVMVVIYLFLGTVRAAVIPIVAVPISLIGAGIVMWAAHFSINILTMLAMVLAIGLVVDDAIIMLENIHRRMHEGEPVLLAAKRGARQVGMAVMSTTLVLAAVFMPIALMRGTTGSLFREFAVTMAIMVLFSLFVSLTLTPVMCSKILKAELDHSRMSRWAESVFSILVAAYQRMLNRTLDRPGLVLGAFGMVVLMAIGLFFVLPQEFTPREDRGVFNITVRPPEGASPAYTERQVHAVYEILKPYLDSGEVVRIGEQVQSPLGGGGGPTGQLSVVMADWSKRSRSIQAFTTEIQPKFAAITGAQLSSQLPPPLGLSGGGYNNINAVFGGPTYDDLRKWRDAMMDGLVSNPMFNAVRNNLVETKPQERINIDRVRAADLGVSVQTIGQTLLTMMGSRRVTTFFDKGEEYDVILQNEADDRRTPNDVSNIYVRSDTTRQLIPLSSVVNLEEGAYASNLNRFNRRRAFIIAITQRPEVPLADVINEVERVAAERLPNTAEITWRGEAGDFKENSSAIYLTFILALIVVFLVLSAQFESFIHPMVVMMTVPLATAGALAGLLLFKQSINLYSQIGIIVLVGLAAKNGILIVEFANQLRDAGREFRQALVEAAMTRFRPIVMTALATVMGSVPLMIATGAGAEFRRPIGVVVFTGVSFATVITLFVIPTFYLLLARRTASPGHVAAQIKAQEAIHREDDRSHQPAE